MNLYQFDKKTWVVFEYIIAHPGVILEYLMSIDDKSLLREKRKAKGKSNRHLKYREDKAINDYATTIIKYLLKNDLIEEEIDDKGYFHYSVSAEGLAYYEHRKSNRIKENLPVIISVLSALISIGSLITNIILAVKTC